MISSLLGRKNKTLNFTKTINCDETTATTPESIADSFNNYFSAVTCKLKNSSFANDLENANSDNYQKFLKRPVARSIYLESVNAGEVYKIIQSFHKHYCNGPSSREYFLNR